MSNMTSSDNAGCVRDKLDTGELKETIDRHLEQPNGHGFEIDSYSGGVAADAAAVDFEKPKRKEGASKFSRRHGWRMTEGKPPTRKEQAMERLQATMGKLKAR